MSNELTLFNQGQTDMISSIVGDDFESKKKVLAATQNAEPLSDHLGKSIEIVHYVVERVEMVNEQTGEVGPAIRTTLITKDGKAFSATSEGGARSIQQITAVLGSPNDWPEPVKVIPTEVKSRKGFKFFTLKLA